MNVKDWRERISRRTDISMGLVHLTKGNGEHNAFKVLMKILEEKTIQANTSKVVDGRIQGFICGNNPVVSFQDVPLYSVSENILWEQELRSRNPKSPIRYEPFGLRFDKRYIFRNGGRPVIYENTETAKSFLPENEHWRIVKLDLENDDKIIDWTHEREWRIKGDFHFELNEVEIILSNRLGLTAFNKYCKKNQMDNLLNEVKGIVVLSSFIF